MDLEQLERVKRMVDQAHEMGFAMPAGLVDGIANAWMGKPMADEPDSRPCPTRSLSPVGTLEVQAIRQKVIGFRGHLITDAELATVAGVVMDAYRALTRLDGDVAGVILTGTVGSLVQDILGEVVSLVRVIAAVRGEMARRRQ